MAKTVQLRTPLQEKEAALVAGMYKGETKAQYELYAYCADYFKDNYKGLFFIEWGDAEEIFQNSFITLWENIQNRKIYVKEGFVTGKDDRPLKGSILTYFMAIARNKYREWLREHPILINPETNLPETDEPMDYGYDSDETDVLEIIADVLSNMSARCYEILTKFYYEEKDLDIILMEIPEINSKDALKTKKHKCLEQLRKTVKAIYYKELNA